jgi:signal transduction histidine kinase
MRRLGLFPKLAFAFLLVFTLAFAGNAALTIRAIHGPLDRLVEDGLALHAQTALVEVQRYLTDCGQEIRLWSSLGVMDAVLTDDRTLNIETLLIQWQREDPERFAKLEVLNIDGVVLASTDVLRVGTQRKPSALRVVTDRAGDFWLGPYPEGDESIEPTIVVAHPIRSRFRSEPIGWLVADVAWHGIVAIVSTAKLGERPQDASGFLTLFDGSGRLLVGEPDLVEQVPGVRVLAHAGGEGVEVRELGAAGTYLAARYERSIGSADPESRLRIVAVLKSEVAGRAVSDLVGAVLNSAVLGLGLAAGASFVIARNLTARIGALSVGTTRIASGDLAYRLREEGGDELEDLARSFNLMGKRLTKVRTERARLEQEILEVSEIERKRTGQELHDGVGQALTGIALLTKSLETRLQARRAAEADDARVIGGLVNHAIGQTRRVSRGLFPVVLEDAGLCGALEDLASGVEAVAPVTCSFSTAGQPDEPSNRLTALYLYRIAQEAVNNALKHGSPSTIEITLAQEERMGRLTIKDDGSGLPTRFEYGMGLRLMRYRASVIGATLHLRGRRGSGSEVSCRFDPSTAVA